MTDPKDPGQAPAPWSQGEPVTQPQPAAPPSPPVPGAGAPVWAPAAPAPAPAHEVPISPVSSVRPPTRRRRGILDVVLVVGRGLRLLRRRLRDRTGHRTGDGCRRDRPRQRRVPGQRPVPAAARRHRWQRRPGWQRRLWPGWWRDHHQRRGGRGHGRPHQPQAGQWPDGPDRPERHDHVSQRGRGDRDRCHRWQHRERAGRPDRPWDDGGPAASGAPAFGGAFGSASDVTVVPK